MDNYLLTVIKEFKDQKDYTDIAVAITPMVHSPNLKFQYTKGVLILHFSSEMNQPEIFEYIRAVLFGVTEFFILSKVTDNLSVSMPDEVHNHLFDLESTDGDVDIRLDMVKIKNNIGFIEEDNEDDDEDEDTLASLLESIREKKLKNKPSLDQILDNIITNGVESLSVFEKNILETYSK